MAVWAFLFKSPSFWFWPKSAMVWIVILQLAFLPLQQHQSTWWNMPCFFFSYSTSEVWQHVCIIQVSFLSYWAKGGGGTDVNCHPTTTSDDVFLHCSSPKVLSIERCRLGKRNITEWVYICGLLPFSCLGLKGAMMWKVILHLPTLSPTVAPPKYFIKHAIGRYCSSDLASASGIWMYECIIQLFCLPKSATR